MDLRRKILDASIQLICEEGIRSVSFREVARRAGVSHQAPYHHFGNYHGILRAIAQEGFRELCAAMNEAAQAWKSDSLRALTESGIAYVLFAREHPGHFRVMFQQTLVDLHDESHPLKEAEQTHQTLTRLAQAAVDDGCAPGVDGALVAHLCWSTVHGFASLLVEGVLGNKLTMTAAQEVHLTRQVVEALARLLQPGSV